MGLEIERKWLPEKNLIDRLSRTVQPVRIEQAYLCRKPVLRVRKENEIFYLTYKGDGNPCHEEYNLPLTPEAYGELLPKHSGIILSKKRYKVPFTSLYPDKILSVRGPEGDLLIELDVFEGEQQGLVILEIEFASVQDAESFLAPEEFGPEVTGKREYSNAWLSLE